MPAREQHRSGRGGWLRAAVLGGDDGIVSTAALLIGVAAAGSARGTVLLAGLAGLVAGALSMAAGEYVSVSSQRDAQRADIVLETRALADDPNAEREELAGLYVRRGLSPDLAAEVAGALMQADALGAHIHDELGLGAAALARPMQAALVSASSFAVGGALPMVTVWFAPADALIAATAVVTAVLLALLGAIGARLGGAPVGRGALRVTVGGGLALLLTGLIGRLIGTGGP